MVTKFLIISLITITLVDGCKRAIHNPSILSEYLIGHWTGLYMKGHDRTGMPVYVARLNLTFSSDERYKVHSQSRSFEMNGSYSCSGDTIIVDKSMNLDNNQIVVHGVLIYKFKNDMLQLEPVDDNTNKHFSLLIGDWSKKDRFNRSIPIDGTY
jgi:hypothetical protein